MRRRQLAAAVVAAQQQRERDEAAAVVVAATAAQQQQDRDEAAAAAAVVASSDHLLSTQQQQQLSMGEDVDDTTVGTIIKVDPLIYGNMQNWPCPPLHEYLDTYQGVHPWKRRHIQPHIHYPLCKIYEHINSIGLATIMWQTQRTLVGTFLIPCVV